MLSSHEDRRKLVIVANHLCYVKRLQVQHPALNEVSLFRGRIFC